MINVPQDSVQRAMDSGQFPWLNASPGAGIPTFETLLRKLATPIVLEELQSIFNLAISEGDEPLARAIWLRASDIIAADGG